MVLTFGNRDAELAPRGTAPAAAPVPAATPRRPAKVPAAPAVPTAAPAVPPAPAARAPPPPGRARGPAARPELPRGDAQEQLAVVRGDLAGLALLAPRAPQPAVPRLEGRAAPGAKGLQDAGGRLRGRELEGRLRLDHLRADDVAEVERVVDVLHVLVGYLRDVDRALRLPRDLALRAVAGGDGRLRHRAPDVADPAVDDVPDLQLRERVEGPHAGDEVLRVELEQAGRGGEDLAVLLVRPRARLVLLRRGDRVAGEDQLPFHHVVRAPSRGKAHTLLPLILFPGGSPNPETATKPGREDRDVPPEVHEDLRGQEVLAPQGERVAPVDEGRDEESEREIGRA